MRQQKTVAAENIEQMQKLLSQLSSPAVRTLTRLKPRICKGEKTMKRHEPTRNRRQIHVATRCLMLTVILCGWLSRISSADNSGFFKSETVVNVDAVGDAKITHELTMPVVPYASLKRTMGDPLQVMHTMDSNLSWLQIDGLTARFDDTHHAVCSDSVCRGLSRTITGTKWCLSVGANDGLEPIDVQNGSAVFGRVSRTAAGIVSNYVRICLPEGSTQVAYDERRDQLTYFYEPEIEDGDRVDTDYRIEARKHIVSSLAKIYGDETSPLWAARSVFKNTGSQRITDFRVRFRVVSYSTWSSWKRSSMVYPGQTVTDYFHPVFDIDKLASLSGTRHAMIETEIEYTTLDGERVADTDSERVQVLSRNEVVYSTRPDDENLTWFDQFDLAPRILSCFTNGTDPVMQQFAGRVSAAAGGPASSLNSEGAIAFLGTMWKVLQENGLAYQTPPAYSVNAYFGQHVKYGRDVLRNRAGTCIDLAILWASAAEAVGLEPHIVLVPGHAFPAVRLPNGNLIPLESTAIGEETFPQAVERGFATLQQWREDGRLMIVNIQELKAEGARSLDLPHLTEDVLAKWGYHFNLSGHAANDRTESASQQPLCGGTWMVDHTVGGTRVVGSQTFEADGRYISALMFIDEGGNMEDSSEYGTYVDHGDYVEFDTNLGNYTQRYRVNGDQMELEFTAMEAWIPYAQDKKLIPGGNESICSII